MTKSVTKLQPTFSQLFRFIFHDCARKIDGLQDIPDLQVSGPILPVKEDALANRLDECRLYRVPVCGTRSLRGLLTGSQRFRTTRG